MKNISFYFILIIIHSAFSLNLNGQRVNYPEERINTIRQLAIEKEREATIQKQKALEFAAKKNIPVRTRLVDGRIMELQYIDESGLPVYYITHNAGAARTVGAHHLYPGGQLGVNITGQGMVAGVWDAGDVFANHREFTGRIVLKNESGSADEHATHVAGTIAASGIQSSARGIAYQSAIYSYDWTNALAEIAFEASKGLLVSNHSYGIVIGWNWEDNKWTWKGPTGANEDYRFGYYSNHQSRALDQIAHNAPYLLMVWSAGNDRNDVGDGSKSPDGPIDCIGPEAIAKNVLAVGSVEKITEGYTKPSDVRMTAYSSWGPSDDGRVKPDLVAPGHNIYSTIATGAYGLKSGTSMAAPVVSGSLLLLQQLHKDLFGNYLRAATLKGLVIHTANPAGNSLGPDFYYGWGLLNTEGAARVIREKNNFNNLIRELVLTSNDTYELEFYADGTKSITATLSWTDPPGTPPPMVINPPNLMLVNDLDMIITDEAGNNYFPFVIEPGQTTGNNFRDNVEKIIIETPSPGKYRLKVSHKGSITGGSQAYSLILTNIAMELAGAPVLYWTGGEGTWENPDNWSFTSGGPSAGQIPGNSYHVIFDENSFTADFQAVTLNTSTQLRSFTYLSNKEANLVMNNHNIGIDQLLLVSSWAGFNQLGGTFKMTGDQTKISLLSQKPYNIEIDNSSGGSEFLNNANLSRLVIKSGSLKMKNGSFTIQDLLTEGVNPKTIDFSNSKVYIRGLWNLTADNLTLLIAGSEIIADTENVEPYEIRGEAIDFHNILILSGKLIIDAAANAEFMHNRGELTLLQGSFSERLRLEPGSKLVIGGGMSLNINQLQISSSLDNFVFIQSSSAIPANIHYDKHLKACFNYLEIHNVTVTGQSTVVAGLNSILAGVTTGWVDKSCQEALFVDFDVKFACERSRTEFIDKSTGQIIEWFWDFGNASDPEGASILKNPFYTYQSAGNYPVSLEITDGTSRKKHTRNIEIRANPYTTNAVIVSGNVYSSQHMGIYYQWFLNGLPISGATSRSFTNNFDLTGEFQVMISDMTCNLMSEPLIVNVDSPTETDYQVLIYPNPFESSVIIEYYSGFTGDVLYQFYDVWGRVISERRIQKNDHLLRINEDLTHLPAGVYFVRIYAGNEIKSRKLVKTR